MQHQACFEYHASLHIGVYVGTKCMQSALKIQTNTEATNQTHTDCDFWCCCQHQDISETIC